MKYLLFALLTSIIVACNTFSEKYETNKPFISFVSDSTPHIYTGLLLNRLTFYQVTIGDSLGIWGTLTADGKLEVYDSSRLIKCLIREVLKRSKPVIVIIDEDTIRLYKGDTIRGWTIPSDTNEIIHRINYKK